MDDTKTLKFILKEYADALSRIKELECELKLSQEWDVINLIEEIKSMGGLITEGDVCPDLLGEDKPEVDEHRYIAFAGGRHSRPIDVNQFFCFGGDIDDICEKVMSDQDNPFYWCDIMDTKVEKVVLIGKKEHDPLNRGNGWYWKKAGNE